MDRVTLMQAFVDVVDAGTFSAAAKRSARSKAVMSKYITQLETHLGVALLQRTTRALSLTEAGRRYYGRCQAVLEEIAALEAAVQEAHSEVQGKLRVSAPPGVADRFLAVLTSDFLAQYPRVKLDLDLTHRMVDLADEGIDVAIRVTQPSDSSLIARRLTPAPPIAVAATDYLEAHGHPKHPRDLLEHACLVDTNFRDQHRWRFDVAGQPLTIAVDGPVRVNSPSAVRELAVRGHGIALVPRILVEPELESGLLMEVLEGMVALDWSIYAVYARRQYLPVRVRCFVDHLIEAFARPGAS
jgi:DNA-binding transcriptional LysR family regulator